MPRGRYPKRIYSTESDEKALNHYRIWWQSKQLHFHPECFPPITVEEFFGVDKKFAIEIGCGDGHFLCALAKRESDVCFLGIDASRKLLELAVSNAVKGLLSNIRFLQADFRFVAPLFLPETVNNFYMHFPAPFNAKSQFKRQTYSKEILSHISKALITSGRLSFITDDETVFDFVCDEMKRIENFRLVCKEDYHLEIEAELKSTYHKFWEKKGRAIHRMEFEKV
jgi:tRNA (guanine-N7-)-methyltransferase